MMKGESLAKAVENRKAPYEYRFSFLGIPKGDLNLAETKERML